MNNEKAPQNIPAGWYQHSHSPSLEAWWDGTKWTSETRNKFQPPPPPPTPPTQQVTPVDAISQRYGSAPPPPQATQPPPPQGPSYVVPQKQTHQPEQNVNLVESLFKWGGPALILIGLILGLSFAVRENYITPPIQLALGVGISASLIAFGEWITKSKKNNLGSLTTGVGFAGLFISSYSVAPIFNTTPSVTIFLTSLVCASTLSYSYLKNDPSMFTFGLFGFTLFPMSFWWNSNDIESSFTEVAEAFPIWQITIPLIVFAGAAFFMRLSKNWTLPWLVSNIGLIGFPIVAFLISLVDSSESTFYSDNTSQFLAVLTLSTISLWVGYALVESKNIAEESYFLSKLEHLSLFGIGLFNIPLILSLLEVSNIVNHLTYGLLAIFSFGISVNLKEKTKALTHQLAGVGSAIYALGYGGVNFFIIVIACIGLIAWHLHERSGNSVWKGLSYAFSILTSFWLFVISLNFFDSNGIVGDFDLGIPSIVALVILNITIYKQISDKIWLTGYPLSLFFLLAILGSSSLGLVLGSLGLVLVGLAALWHGSSTKLTEPIWAGLLTILATSGKVVLIDLAGSNVLAKAGIAILIGIILILVSYNFDKIRELLDVENEE